MQAPVRSACVEVLEERVLLSRSWFVAPFGNDGGAGTLSSPFRTISRAASLANWGDTVDIEAGTYHETVKPARSGVTFVNYNGANVTVSGTDNVGGFWKIGGDIYEANLPVNLGEGNNQVFVDGKLMNEARWPNSNLDPSHPAKAYIQGYSGGTIYNTSLSQPNGFWTGAQVRIFPGNGWVGYSAYVTSSGPGWIHIAGLPGLSSWEAVGKGNPFYLYGKFQAIDSPGEWYIDSSSHLYLWDPASDNPSYHTVEVKARQWAFDLSAVSNTTIQGINIFAASIHTGWSSSNTVLNHINASYIDQVGWISNGWSVNEPWGIELMGAGSILENSTIAYSASDGVYVGGNNVTVRNNVIHDVDYSGIDAAGVRVYGQYANVSYNTIYNAGRDGINYKAPHTTIAYNTIHDVMLQTTDGGGIYAVQLNGQGSQIYGNVVYNVNSGGYGAAGIFLDNNCSSMVIHNNTVWNTNAGLKINFTSYNEQVYSNAISGNQYSVANNGNYSWGGSQFHNNVYYNRTVQMGSGASQWSNAFSSGSPVPSAYQAPPTTTTTTTTTSTTSATTTIKALNYNGGSGVANSGGAVGYTVNGSWVEYNNIDFGTGALTKFLATIAVGPGYAGQKIVLHLDGLTGTTIGTLTTTGTGGWQTYVTQSAYISKVTGVHKLYIQFVGWNGIANLMSFRFA